MNRTYLSALGAMMMPAAAASAVSLGQVDTFDSNTQNWLEGLPSPNQPFITSDGGSGDNFLRNVSSGDNAPGGAMAMFNRAQWAGDYVSAGVNFISMDVRNSGESDLFMRMAFQGSDGTRYATNGVYLIEPGTGWQSISFSLTDMTLIAGGTSLFDTLGNVFEARLLSAVNPSFQGDFFEGTLDVDNIRALPLPSPGAGGLLAVAGIASLRRRR